MKNVQDGLFQLAAALESGNGNKSEKNESSDASREMSGTKGEWKHLACSSVVLVLLMMFKTKTAARPLVWVHQMS